MDKFTKLMSKVHATGLTNHFIDEFMAFQSKYYSGCFSCDTIPLKIINQKRFAIVVNLSKQDTEGSHFVSIYKCHSEIYYFDSYGLPNINPFIQSFLAMCGDEYTYSSLTIQEIFSFSCGWFCIAFILFLEKYQDDYSLFLSQFSGSLREKELKLYNMLKNDLIISF